jgi:hypothetical protein
MSTSKKYSRPLGPLGPLQRPLQSFIHSRASKILKRSKAIVRKGMLKNKINV